jgi:hypothetical protein
MLTLIRHRRKSFRDTAGGGGSSGLVTSGLELYLDAGDSSSYSGSGTTWTDLSGNGNDGTLVNGVGYSSADGGSLSFDGTNDYVSIPNVATSKDCTICLWFKENNTGDWTELFTFQTGSDSTSTKVEATNVANEYKSYNGGFVHGTTLFYHSGSLFQHLALVFDSSNATCYQNASQTVQTISSDFGTASTIHLGRQITNSSSYSNWTGNIAQCLIYDRPLTSSEVTQNFDAHKNRYGYQYATIGMTIDATWNTIGTAYTTLDDATSASVKVYCNFDKDDTGILMEHGGSAYGLVLYIYNETLYFQCGEGGTAGGDSDTGEVSYTVTNTTAQDFIIEWSADTSGCALYVDGELQDTDVFSASKIAGGNDGTIGQVYSAVPVNRGSSGSFTGTVTKAEIFLGEVTSDVSGL